MYLLSLAAGLVLVSGRWHVWLLVLLDNQSYSSVTTYQTQRISERHYLLVPDRSCAKLPKGLLPPTRLARTVRRWLSFHR